MLPQLFKKSVSMKALQLSSIKLSKTRYKMALRILFNILFEGFKTYFKFKFTLKNVQNVKES